MKLLNPFRIQTKIELTRHKSVCNRPAIIRKNHKDHFKINCSSDNNSKVRTMGSCQSVERSEVTTEKNGVYYKKEVETKTSLCGK